MTAIIIGIIILIVGFLVAKADPAVRAYKTIIKTIGIIVIIVIIVVICIIRHVSQSNFRGKIGSL